MKIIVTYFLYEPCLQGSGYWINYCIKKGADEWNWGLEGACKGGHLDIIELMIDKGANWGLEGACKGGHLDIIELMIEKGAKDWNWGLEGACEGGHLDIIKLMIKKGAEPLDEYEIPFIPKNDKIIEIIYASMYDYLPDEMINIVLQYSIVEDFNLYKWKLC